MYQRGSEWRKWDLHVHTPDSIVHEYKQGDKESIWDNYLEKLQLLPDNIKVLGINDYWFLDGFKKVKEFKDSGKLPNIELILPVIELRLRDYVGNNSLNKINYHIIFSDELSIDEIESEFINKIEMTEFENRSLSVVNLENFGNKIKQDTPADKRPKDSDKQIGFNNFTISLDKVNELLLKKLFKGKFLRVIGQTEWSDFRWEGSPADKKSLINNVDFIFSASPTIENAMKSKQSLITQEVNYKLLHCSDAHQFFQTEFTSKILGHCFSWIKADPTFKGLQQVLHDFEERVFIGDEPEILKRVHSNKTKYIKSLDIRPIAGYTGNKGLWFSDFATLEFNKELVAIIGNKGNGKSAISDIIGLLTNSSNQSHFSFLNKQKFFKNKLADNFEAELTFESNDKLTKLLSESIEANPVERVRYLPQNYFEKLCNDLEGEGFEESLQKVVFTHLPSQYRLGKNSFEELINFKTESIESDVQTLLPKIHELNKKIISLERKNIERYLRTINEKFKIKWNEYKQHQKDKPQKIEKPNFEEGSDNETKFKTLEELKKQLQQKEEGKKSLSARVSELMKQDGHLKILKADFERLENHIKSVLEVTSTELEKYNLDVKKIFNYTVNYEIINSKIDEIDISSAQSMKLIYDKETNTGLSIDIQKLQEDIKQRESKLSSVQKEYQIYLSKIKEWEEQKNNLIADTATPDSIKGLISELKYIKNELYIDLTEARSQRLAGVEAIYNKKSEIVDTYKKLKESIDSTLEDYKDVLVNYSISINATFKLNNFEDSFLNFISQNKMGSFYGKDDGKQRLKGILEDKDFNNFQEFKEILINLIEHLEKDFRRNEAKMNIEDQVNNSDELYKYLFSINYLVPNYELMLDGKTLNELSPGEKGALLLVFYLMLDKEDIPLIIDQPEDNLDNQSVAKIVVEFIKIAKKRRQIFMVTHNPNLAVVADAEQIVHVKIDKQNNNVFSYLTGSIENPEINQCLVDVLEGTLPAFGKRKNKYMI
ncbi:MAG: AAA family ATPase [Sulfuricurvum sp.]|nr:AAA family ATPase [Sulfuricurvum sp.]MDD5387506.1 AAA family ATPase [Sulfuricurvum sp.]